MLFVAEMETVKQFVVLGGDVLGSVFRLFTLLSEQ